MYEIGQKPLPLRSRPFFGSRRPQRIPDVRQRIPRAPRSTARASSTRARDPRASRPGRRSPTRSTSSTRSPIQASRSRRLDHEQRPTDRFARSLENKPLARCYSWRTTTPKSTLEDNGSRITDHIQRAQIQGSRIMEGEPSTTRTADRPGERSPSLEIVDLELSRHARAHIPGTHQGSPTNRPGEPRRDPTRQKERAPRSPFLVAWMTCSRTSPGIDTEPRDRPRRPSRTRPR